MDSANLISGEFSERDMSLKIEACLHSTYWDPTTPLNHPPLYSAYSTDIQQAYCSDPNSTRIRAQPNNIAARNSSGHYLNHYLTSHINNFSLEPNSTFGLPTQNQLSQDHNLHSISAISSQFTNEPQQRLLPCLSATMATTHIPRPIPTPKLTTMGETTRQTRIGTKVSTRNQAKVMSIGSSDPYDNAFDTHATTVVPSSAQNVSAQAVDIRSVANVQGTCPPQTILASPMLARITDKGSNLIPGFNKPSNAPPHVARAIRMRVKRMCHHCQTLFQRKECATCSHVRCEKCVKVSLGRRAKLRFVDADELARLGI
ncbi:hypothetical protein B0O99DRAFT_587725 [Bisporella sp. PMI_857]|nr:hypothetical protein B0O99DRAFT_587725 [Bisporella sp. PMI_857]